MRTTVTLDPDVAELLAEATRRERRSTKAVINDALRRALRSATSEPYSVEVHQSRVRGGVDLARLNQLADEVMDDEVIDGLRA